MWNIVLFGGEWLLCTIYYACFIADYITTLLYCVYLWINRIVKCCSSASLLHVRNTTVGHKCVCVLQKVGSASLLLEILWKYFSYFPYTFNNSIKHNSDDSMNSCLIVFLWSIMLRCTKSILSKNLTNAEQPYYYWYLNTKADFVQSQGHDALRKKCLQKNNIWFSSM